MNAPLAGLLTTPQNPSQASASPTTETKATPEALAASIFPNIDPELLKNPAVRYVALGRPPAVRLPAGYYYPDVAALGRKLPNLIQAGLDVYHAQSGDLVLFNPLLMPLEELQTIDQRNKLADLVPEYGTLTGQQPREMTDAEATQQVADAEDLLRGLAALGTSPQSAPTSGPPPAQTPVPPPNPSAVSAINRNRLQNAQAGSPTSGPAPGAGRVLNGLLKPAL